MENKELSNSDIDILLDLDFLVSVIVAIGEVANITGVPQRKIRYWDEKGYIVPVDKTSTYRQYDYLNVKKVVLIQELLDEGFTLEVSAKKVNERSVMVAEAFHRLKKTNGISNSDKEILLDLDFLASVIVAIGEVANITGVPQRKIRYWDEKGYIVPVDKSSTYRQYDYLNFKKVVLIQQLLEEGFTLEVSAKKVHERSTKVAEAFHRLKDKKGIK